MRVEHRPYRGVAAVGDDRAAGGEQLADHRRHVRGMHRRAVVGERAFELGAVAPDMRAILLHSLAAPGAIHPFAFPLALPDARGERRQKNADVGLHRDVRGPVGAEHRRVDVHLHRAQLGGRAPIRRLSPAVRLAQSRSEDEHRVGLVAHELVELHVRHRDRERRILVEHTARGPARGHRRLEQVGDLAQRIPCPRVHHAAPRVDDRQAGDEHHIGGALHVGGICREWRGSPVLRRIPDGDVGLHLAVHQVLGDVEVHHAGPAVPAFSQGGAHELGNPFEARRGAAPLRERADHGLLIEALIGSGAERVHRTGAPRARNAEDAIALRLLHHETAQDVGDARAIARHAHAKPPGESRVGRGRVGGTGLVAGCDEANAEPVEGGVEAEVGAVDDAEDDIDAFSLQHAGEHFAASRGVHGVSAVSPGFLRGFCGPGEK